MRSDPQLPHEVAAISSSTLLVLEDAAMKAGLNQRLPRAWLDAHVDPEGTHYLWPALWNQWPHRRDLPGTLRCELLLQLRGGEQVLGLLDTAATDFASLPRLTDLGAVERVRHLLDTARSVREWNADHEVSK